MAASLRLPSPGGALGHAAARWPTHRNHGLERDMRQLAKAPLVVSGLWGESRAAPARRRLAGQRQDVPHPHRPWTSHNRPSLRPIHRPRQSPTRSSGLRAQTSQFQAQKTISLPVEEGRLSVEQYLSNIERIVNVAFPDKGRLERLAEDKWRVLLKPVSFFSASARPVADIRAWFEASRLRIFSDRVALDLAGLPPELVNVDLRLSLNGSLGQMGGRAATGTASEGTPCVMTGAVDLRVEIDLPPPFSFIPAPMVEVVGNGIADSILGALQQRLLLGLVADYQLWCVEDPGHGSGTSVDDLRRVATAPR